MKAVLVAVAACAPVALPATPARWVDDTSSMSPTTPSPIADRYREVATKIIAAARADRGAYSKLAHLTDRIGNRLSGSPALDQAIAWAAQTMKDDGLDVRLEKVMVPRWARGKEEAAITAPVARPLHVLALGGSIATPKGGITAPIVIVHDWKQLDAKQEQLKGAIVVYNVAMPAWTEEHGTGYGKTVEYRFTGPSQAAKRGAVAVLVRSVTARSLATPHTGALGYAKDVAKIPAAAISVEDAELLDRLAASGAVSVHLDLQSQSLPDVESSNVIGELRGRERPDEVVVIGAHIDSWDVGQGAHDDGAGCATMMQALRVLAQLAVKPRRTIRVVLFTNEENGMRGAKAYAEQHAAELRNTVLAMEADSGGFAPRGFSVDHADGEAAKRVRARIADIASLLGALGPMRVFQGGGGTDIGPMQPAGVPQVGLEVDNRTYFDYHHTEADTLDKVDPADLASMVAAIAVLAYVVADLPDRIDERSEAMGGGGPAGSAGGAGGKAPRGVATP